MQDDQSLAAEAVLSHEGMPSGPTKILVAVAGTEAEVNAALERGARARLTAAGAEVETIRLPLVSDLPQALALAERMCEFDGYVALGAVIGTSRVGTQVIRALTGLGMSGGLVGIGVVQADTVAAAQVAADPTGADAGGVAASSVLGLIALSRTWSAKTKGIGFRA